MTATSPSLSGARTTPGGSSRGAPTAGERPAKLEELTETVEEYLGDLPQIIHGGQTDIGAERYRWAYELPGLRVVAHRDGILELTWRAGSEVLGPEEPRELELPPPDYSGWALSVSSDSQR